MPTRKTSKEPPKRKSRSSNSQSAQPQGAESRVTEPSPRKKRTRLSQAKPQQAPEMGALTAALPLAEPSSPTAAVEPLAPPQEPPTPASAPFTQPACVVAPYESVQATQASPHTSDGEGPPAVSADVPQAAAAGTRTDTQSPPEQDATVPTQLMQITAWYLDTAERFAQNALTLQKQTLTWGHGTPWGPLLETQHTWTSQWVDRMTTLSRTFWRLEAADQGDQTHQSKEAGENAG